MQLQRQSDELAGVRRELEQALMKWREGQVGSRWVHGPFTAIIGAVAMLQLMQTFHTLYVLHMLQTLYTRYIHYITSQAILETMRRDPPIGLPAAMQARMCRDGACSLLMRATRSLGDAN